MWKKILFIGFIVLIALVIWQFQLIRYGWGQAKGQFTIMRNAQPIETFLNDPEYPDSLKQKIRLTQEIRDFAVQELGMKGEKNYTKMYDQKGQPVLWVVTAAPEFKLEAKQWHFPIIGSFSYKGFFDYQEALKEAELLKKQDLDVNIGEVNAWSTLGWLRDPLLSSMLNKNVGNLADLIIHELTHTTIFIKSDVQFNENLATFVGNRGAELFLIRKYGGNSSEFSSYLSAREDRKKFTDHILRGADYIDSIYQKMDTTLQHEDKLLIKATTIREVIQQFDTLEFNQPKRYAGYFDDYAPDNTFFLSFLRYRANLDDLEMMYQQDFESDLRAFIDHFKNHNGSLVIGKN